MANRSSKLSENLAASITTIYASMAALVCAYVLVAHAAHDHLSALRLLKGIDRLEMVRAVALGKVTTVASFRRSDLPQFFDLASARAYEPLENGGDPYTEEILSSRGFTKAEVPGAHIAKAPTRLWVSYCQVAIFRPKGGSEFTFITAQVVSNTYKLNSEDISFASAERCGDEYHFLFFKRNDDTVVILPKSIERDFPPIAPPMPFTSFEMGDDDKERYLLLLPEELRPFVRFDEPMIALNLKAIEYYLLSYAAKRHNKYYDPSQLPEAIDSLFVEREQQTSFMGITSNTSLLLALGPVALWVISFELWRRVRRYPIPPEPIPMFWFAADATDRVGLFIARIYATAPVLAAVIVYSAYMWATQSFGLAIREIVRLFDLIWLFGQPLVAMQWVQIDWLATFFALFLMPLQLFWSYATTKSFLTIANGYYTHGEIGSKGHSSVWRRFFLRRWR